MPLSRFAALPLQRASFMAFVADVAGKLAACLTKTLYFGLSNRFSNVFDDFLGSLALGL